MDAAVHIDHLRADSAALLAAYRGRPARAGVARARVGPHRAARTTSPTSTAGCAPSCGSARRADPLQQRRAGARRAPTSRRGSRRAPPSWSSLLAAMDLGRDLADLGRSAAGHLLPPADGPGDRRPPVGRRRRADRRRPRRRRRRRAARAVRAAPPRRAARRRGRHRSTCTPPTPTASGSSASAPDGITLRARPRQGRRRPCGARRRTCCCGRGTACPVDDRFEVFGDAALLETWRDRGRRSRGSVRRAGRRRTAAPDSGACDPSWYCVDELGEPRVVDGVEPRAGGPRPSRPPPRRRARSG